MTWCASRHGSRSLLRLRTPVAIFPDERRMLVRHLLRTRSGCALLSYKSYSITQSHMIPGPPPGPIPYRLPFSSLSFPLLYQSSCASLVLFSPSLWRAVPSQLPSSKSARLATPFVLFYYFDELNLTTIYSDGSQQGLRQGPPRERGLRRLCHGQRRPSTVRGVRVRRRS
jgi:hypothetical protein